MTEEGSAPAHGWSRATAGVLWLAVFVMWRSIAVVALWRPGFLADVPGPAVWIGWAVLAPLAIVAVIANVARSFKLPVRRLTLVLVLVAIGSTGVIATLLVGVPIEPHPFPDLGGFVVASVATIVYFFATELRRG